MFGKFDRQMYSQVTYFPYLPPIFKEVFAKDILSGVLVIQHLGKECGHLFCSWAELHVLTLSMQNRCFVVTWFYSKHLDLHRS